MMTSTRRRYPSQAGFTLIEVLAAFAITALVIMGLGTLINHVTLTFDRGINGVTEAERFALAMDRLARDFAATHFVALREQASPQRDLKQAGGPPLAFVGQATRIVFISTGALDGTGSEVVTLTAEPLEGDLSQLVRRRAPWLGPGAGSLQQPASDPVVLLKGRYDISFSFGRLADQGEVDWTENWSNRPTLPRLIRLNLRDAVTGASLVSGADFILRADAPAACGNGAADCLPAKDGPGPQKQERSAT